MRGGLTPKAREAYEPQWLEVRAKWGVAAA